MILTSTLPQLGDSGPYFLSHAQRLAAADYRPSDEDILRARSVTHGIVVVPFQVDTDVFFRCRTSFYSAYICPPFAIIIALLCIMFLISANDHKYSQDLAVYTNLDT